jgi:CRP/FNR family transcriptional regulator, cyclic AMP receptor protein
LRVLLPLANFGKEGTLELSIPPISKELLAASVGTTRSRINIFMNKFHKLGLIEYNGHRKVLSALLGVVVSYRGQPGFRVLRRLREGRSSVFQAGP